MTGVSPARALGAFLAGIFALSAVAGSAAEADAASPAQVRETEAGWFFTTTAGMTELLQTINGPRRWFRLRYP